MAHNSKSWLGDVASNPRLYEIVMPGSHDAGVYGVSLSREFGVPKRFSRCQGSNIYNQAASGSRMFDCRVFLKKDKVTKKIVPTMGHFGGKSFEKWKHVTDKGSVGTLGAFGGTFITAIKDAIAFVRTYTTEFLILRFSHTYCSAEVGTALWELMDANPELGNYIYRSNNNIAISRLSDLRGKVILVFASEFHTNFKSEDGYLPFYKYEDGMDIPAGLATCGIFKGSEDMKKVRGSAARGADEHAHHPADHLHFVYWQQTMNMGLGNIEKNTKSANSLSKTSGLQKAYSGGAHGNIGTFVDEVIQNVQANRWKLPNVISHDFVSAETCAPIIELNWSRVGTQG